MKITGYRTEAYLMRMDRLIGDANLPEGVDLMPGSVLFLETDANLTGISLGYGGDLPPWMFEAVEGRDPREVLAHWSRLNDLLHKGGNRGAATLALSALDMALWDLKAKAAGEPLWRLLGARDGRVPAYASGLDYPLSDDELFAFYHRMALQGIHAGKLKVGLDSEADLRRLGIMQEALAASGKAPQLMVDANEYWSAKEAVRQIRRLEEKFELTWVEEPARRWDYDGLKLVSQQVRAAVATGENLQSVADLYPLVSEQAVDVINVSTNHSGVTGCRQIAHLAHVYSIPVTMNNAQANYMAHVAAALPTHWMMEIADPGREHCLRFDNHVEDGCIVLGDSPGFGIEVDRVRLEALQRSPPTGQGRFPFPRGEGAGLRVTPPAKGKLPWR
ncbi:MAG: mandelate racemase/muconate lactonizing enzyme family protein [Steroidobacteraceae bacterium]